MALNLRVTTMAEVLNLAGLAGVKGDKIYGKHIAEGG